MMGVTVPIERKHRGDSAIEEERLPLEAPHGPGVAVGEGHEHGLNERAAGERGEQRPAQQGPVQAAWRRRQQHPARPGALPGNRAGQPGAEQQRRPNAPGRPGEARAIQQPHPPGQQGRAE
ncbi:MAG: hypothetical protein MI924_28740, partial [Chloroflexales bacterium]|nr:hypothetical protein [Chloroflexales bacterium]